MAMLLVLFLYGEDNAVNHAEAPHMEALGNVLVGILAADDAVVGEEENVANPFIILQPGAVLNFPNGIAAPTTIMVRHENAVNNESTTISFLHPLGPCEILAQEAGAQILFLNQDVNPGDLIEEAGVVGDAGIAEDPAMGA